MNTVNLEFVLLGMMKQREFIMLRSIIHGMDADYCVTKFVFHLPLQEQI